MFKIKRTLLIPLFNKYYALIIFKILSPLIFTTTKVYLLNTFERTSLEKESNLPTFE
jgi:hypothetical protein